MANEPNQTPDPNTQGNDSSLRDSNGTIQDQNSSTNQSGTDQKTNSDPSPEPKKSSTFLNQKDEPKAEPKKEEPKLDKDGNPIKEEPPKKEEPKPGAPEKYEDFKLPDGYKFDDSMQQRVTGLFKELGLSQEGAQKLVDLYSETAVKTAQMGAEANGKLWDDTNAAWVKEINDTWGEDKAKTMNTELNKGFDAAFPNKKQNAAIREALDVTGAGSHPALFEALHTLLKPFTEGTPVLPGKVNNEANKDPAKAQQITPAEAMYGHLRK